MCSEWPLLFHGPSSPRFSDSEDPSPPLSLCHCQLKNSTCVGLMCGVVGRGVQSGRTESKSGGPPILQQALLPPSRLPPQ